MSEVPELGHRSETVPSWPGVVHGLLFVGLFLVVAFAEAPVAWLFLVIYGVAVYPAAGTANDGKIVVAGDHSSSTAAHEFALGRFNGDGSLDTTFNSSGIVTTPIGTTSHAYGVVLQPSDDKIVAAGKTTGSETDMALARYLNDGMPAAGVTATRAETGSAISAGMVDSFFADIRAVAILLSADAPATKH